MTGPQRRELILQPAKQSFGGGRGRLRVVGAASFRLLYPVFSSLQPAASPTGNGEGLPIQRNVSLIRSRPQSAHTMELSIDSRLSRALAGSEHSLSEIVGFWIAIASPPV